MREPIVDAVGVERFVEGVASGRHSGSRSRRITPLAGVASLILLMVIIGVVVGELGMEESADADVQAKATHSQRGGSFAAIDTPAVDKPLPTNEMKRSSAEKDTATKKRVETPDPRPRIVAQDPTPPQIRVSPTAKNLLPARSYGVPNRRDPDVLLDMLDTSMSKTLKTVTPVTPDQAATLLRDSIANANALRTLHIDGITPLALSAQELWRLGVRIEPDTIRIIPGGRSASGLLTYVYPLSKGTIRSSFIAEDADSTSSAAMLALGGGMYPPHTWVITDPSGVIRMSTLGVPSFRSATSIGELDTAALKDQQDLWNLLDSASPERMSPAELTRILADAKKKAVARDTYNPNHLIPIRAAAADAPDSVGLILWYDPSPHLLSRLPRWVWISLRDQIDLVDTSVQSADDRSWSRYTSALLDSLLSIREREAEGRGGDRPHPGESLLGIGQTSAGAIASSSVSPNPIGGETKLFYELTEARTIAAGLYDLHGTRVKEFFSLRRKEEGHHRIPLDIAGVPAGVYLVALLTDQGERAVQRVVVP